LPASALISPLTDGELILIEAGLIVVAEIVDGSMPTIWLPPPETRIEPLGGSFKFTDTAIRFWTDALVVAELLSAGVPLSVTINVTRYDPDAAYAWLANALDAVPPSPKSQAYVSALPSGSEEPEPLNEIGWPVAPEYGPPGFDTGGVLPAEIVIVMPSLSYRSPAATENVIEWEPASEAPGVQSKWPEFVSNVAPTGRPTTPNVRASLSPSLPVTSNARSANANPVLLPIGFSVGAVFPRPVTFTVNVPFDALLLNESIPLAAPPDAGVNDAQASIEPPAGIDPDALLENAGFEDETDDRFSVASPVFETVKQNEADPPTFTVP